MPSVAPTNLRGTDSSFGALLALGAATAIAHAVRFKDGMYAAEALPYLLAAFGAISVAVLVPKTCTMRWFDAAANQLLPFAAVGALGWQVAVMLTARSPAVFLGFQHDDQAKLFGVYIGFMAVLAGRLVHAGRFTRVVVGATFLSLFALLGLWLLRFSPNPDIDVVMVHRHSLDALWIRQNPYAITFPAPAANNDVFGPGMVQNGRLMFGYTYPPLNLLLGLPAHLLGDYRGALLLAMIFTALAMAQLCPQPTAWLPSCLLLLSPRILYQLEMGWTEPISLALLVGLVWAQRHKPGLMGPLLGLLLASKQYVFLFAATATLLPGLSLQAPQGRRAWMWAALTGAAVTLPFVLWSPKDFWHDLITTQLNLPFRADALNFSGWYLRYANVQLSSVWGFVAGAASLLWCLWRMPRTRAGFCLSFAYVFLCFITFNRQAYANYYYYIEGALLTAVAATPLGAPAAPGAPEPLPKTPPQPGRTPGALQPHSAGRRGVRHQRQMQRLA